MKYLPYLFVLFLFAACGAKPGETAAPAPTPHPVEAVFYWSTDVFLEIDETSSLLVVPLDFLTLGDELLVGFYTLPAGAHCFATVRFEGDSPETERIVVSGAGPELAYNTVAEHGCEFRDGTYAYAPLDPNTAAPEMLDLVVWKVSP